MREDVSCDLPLLIYYLGAGSEVIPLALQQAKVILTMGPRGLPPTRCYWEDREGEGSEGESSEGEGSEYEGSEGKAAKVALADCGDDLSEVGKEEVEEWEEAKVGLPDWSL